MARKILSILLTIFILITSLTGCNALLGLSHMLEALQPEQETLPTLPPAVEDSLIPIDVLIGYNEYYFAPQISADGGFILYRYMTQSSDNIFAENLQTGERTMVKWPGGPRGIPYYSWAPDGHTVLLFMDSMGDENFGLYTSDIATGKTATLLLGGENSCYYVSDNPKNEDEIFITIFNRSTFGHDLYVINYKTGDKILVMENPGNILDYHTDKDGSLRLISRTDESAGHSIWQKKSNAASSKFIEDDWEQILYWDYADADTSHFVGFMQDNLRFTYIDSASANTSELFLFNLDTKEKTSVFNDIDYDIFGMWIDIELDEVTAVTTMGEYIDWHILDESFADDYEVLNAVGDSFNIVGSSKDDAYWIVEYVSDIKEADYYIYEMQTREIDFLYNARPEIEKYEFAPMEPFSYIAGDGLKIEGYVTFPVGSDRENLPTVVLVHGGPWLRDVWGFNFETQLLANWGYAVLQVNFRGSSGYGKDFMRAGDREWGNLMHQDILDAVNFAIDKGWTDPGRVGVYGASYGGYEALVCAAFSSDVFKCAVDAFGPSNLITLIEGLRDEWQVVRDKFIKAVGDPATEPDFLKSRSPLFYARQIEIPLLIAQGGNDPRVKQIESDQMVDALQAACIPYKYLLFPNSGHGLNSYEDRYEFYTEMEAFFAEHLGGLAG